MMNRIAPPVGGVGLVVLLIVLAVVWKAAPGGDAGAEAKKPLLIVADEWKPMHVLADFLRTRGKRHVTCADQKDLPPNLAGFQAVFMYLHGPMTDKTETALVHYAQRGGRLVILHHGIASARRNNPKWMRLTGMYIAPSNDPAYPWKVLGNTTHTLVNLQPRHYITSHNVKYDRLVEYRSSDAPSRPAKCPALDLKNTEVFLNQHFTDGREKTVLFGFRVDAGGGKTIMQDRAGWYKPAAKGWVFYLQPGHCVSDFQHPAYRQIILNCLTWHPAMPPQPRPAGVKK